MPGPNFVLDVGYKCAAAIPRFTLVKLSADDTVTPCTAATDAAIGVCQEEITTADATNGRVAEIRILGISRVIAGASVTRGTPVSSDGAGKAIAAVSTSRICGEFLTSGSTSDQVNMLVVAPTALMA
jgi:hypothetical protein